MCSIKATLELGDGKQETFCRPAEVGAGDGTKGDLGKLGVWIGEVQKDLNTALTAVVERERQANSGNNTSNKVPDRTGSEDDEEDDDEDEEEDEANGKTEPPVKKKKT